MGRLLAVATIVVLCVQTISAGVGSTNLDSFIQGCDLVVRGTVVEIVITPHGTRLATLNITETLRGRTNSTTVRYIASPFYTEDISDGKVGESVVLFLQKFRKPPKDYPPEINKVTQGEPLFFIVVAGRGRLVPTRIRGVDYVYFRKKGVILLPKKLLEVWTPDPKDSALGTVRLHDLLDYIRAYSPE
jgi:hypothetical protein